MNNFQADIETAYPVEVFVGNLGDDHNIEFRLGYLMDTEQVVLMSVCLVDGATFLESDARVFDLRFGVRLKYIEREWNVTAMDYSQAAKRRYIHENNREVIRSLICRAISGLVNAVKPEVITMSTYDTELPEPALVKYRVIEACLNEHGFRTEAAYRDDGGRDRWHFVRAT